MRNDFDGNGLPPPPLKPPLQKLHIFFVNKLNTVNKKTIKSQMYKKIQSTDFLMLRTGTNTFVKFRL